MDRLDRPRGGVMIVIKKRLNHSLLPSLNTKLIECVGVQLITDINEKIDFFSIYLPGGATNDDINTHYENDLTKIIRRSNSFFALGDLNSRNRFWNCIRANQGKILYETYLKNNITILYPSSPTYFPPDRRRKPSTIDLALTNGLHETSSLECLQLTSDHNPVKFTIKLSGNITYSNNNLVRLYRAGNWKKYRYFIDREFSEENCNTQ
jgi:hypothetical protein